MWCVNLSPFNFNKNNNPKKTHQKNPAPQEHYLDAFLAVSFILHLDDWILVYCWGNTFSQTGLDVGQVPTTTRKQPHMRNPALEEGN